MTGHGRGRWGLLLRSFVVQGSWNYRTLLGSGFAWALGPAGGVGTDAERRITGEGPGEEVGGRDPFASNEGLEVARAAEPFNAHPYLTPIALGALHRLRRDPVGPDRIRVFRQALRSPLGSLGDALVWGAWRPACLVGAGLIALLGGAPGVVVTAFLGVYNLVHFGLRIRGLDVGTRSGLDVASGIRAMHLPEWTERIRRAGVLFLGLACGLLAGRVADGPEGGPVWVMGALVLFLAGLLGGDAVRRWGPEILLLFVLVGSWIAPA